MNNDHKTIRVVAAAITYRRTILVAQRPRSEPRYQSLKLEFATTKREVDMRLLQRIIMFSTMFRSQI